MTPKGALSKRRPYIEYMGVFRCITYAMVPAEKRSKLDAKNFKCLFIGYCACIKVHRVMSLKTNKNIKIKDVVLMEDGTSFGNILEMRPSGRNEAPMVVGKGESSKSPLFGPGRDIKGCEDQVEDNQVAIQETRKIPSKRRYSSTSPSHKNCKDGMHQV